MCGIRRFRESVSGVVAAVPLNGAFRHLALSHCAYSELASDAVHDAALI
jgi:hypothetical protein